MFPQAVRFASLAFCAKAAGTQQDTVSAGGLRVNSYEPYFLLVEGDAISARLVKICFVCGEHGWSCMCVKARCLVLRNDPRQSPSLATFLQSLTQEVGCGMSYLGFTLSRASQG